jgi:predicted nucleic acid-binding protein
MTYLIDTCIISKLRKIRSNPDPTLENWISKHQESQFFLSVLTIGEIQSGIAKLKIDHPQEQKKRMVLEDWLFGELIPRFKNRLLTIDLHVAITLGKIHGNNQRLGQNIPLADGLIAATAIVHGLVVVTENIRHFQNSGAEIFNPWA